MPSTPLTPEYDVDVVSRLVNTSGFVSWKGEYLLVTRLLASQPVGFKSAGDEEWQVFYGPILLGWVGRRNGKLRLQPLP